MLTKTKGIIIKTIKYGDASAITKIYTEEFGLLGYHLPSVFKNKGRIKPSHLQPLNCVELSFIYNATKNLSSIKDFTCHSHFNSTRFSQQAYYNVIVELLSQTLKEHEQNKTLFTYIHDELIPSLDAPPGFWQLPTAMLEVLYHYGCAPNIDFYEKGAVLDLRDGIFIHSPSSKYMALPDVSATVYTLLRHGADELPQDGDLRHRVIEDIIKYCQWHISEQFDLRSRDVLWQVMKG